MGQSLAADAGQPIAGRQSDDERVTVVFGLRRAQLQFIVESIVQDAVATFDVAVERNIQGHYGAHGQKLLPVFSWRTRGGQIGRAEVFAKRSAAPGAGEARLYRQLWQQRVPVPRLYGSALDAAGHEVLFLESLPCICTGSDLLNEPLPTDPTHCRQFLQALGRINATQVSEELAEIVPLGRLGRLVADQIPCLPGICQAAGAGHLGCELRSLCSSSAQKQLAANARRLVEAVDAMDTALTHGDYFPRHMGWRDITGETVIFDWATAHIAARFFDAAPFFGAPDDALLNGHRRDEAATWYLQSLAECGGVDQVSREQFLCEARMVWLAWNCRRLPRLLKQAESPQDADMAAQHQCARRELLTLLASLLKVPGPPDTVRARPERV